MKKILLIILTLSISLTPGMTAKADINTDMDTMFQKFGFKTASTSGGAYMAQTHGVITGGSFNARASYTPIQLFSITPPHMKAGCGGLDMFWGGLNFVNKEEFTNMLKSVGTGAIGYAFQLGLETLCPQCNSAIKWLDDKIKGLNKLRTDSCTAAKGIVNWSVGSIAEGAMNDCMTAEINDGTDADTAYADCVTNSQTKTKLYNLNDTAISTRSVSPAIAPGVQAYHQLGFSSLDDTSKMFAVSLVGTYYRKMSDSGASTLEYTGHTLSLRDIIYGTPDAYVIVKDGDDNVTVENWGLLDGFEKRVTDQLNIIIPKLSAGIKLSDEEQAFVNASNIPVKMLVQSTEMTPGLLDSAITLTSDLVALDMAYTLIKGYLNAFESSSGKQSIVANDQLLSRLAEVKQDLNSEMTKEGI
jgi:conjugative transfer pilus assembly protein TraH